MGYRKFIADKIQAELGDGFTVYEGGADIVATPAVVVHPADPYIVPTTMGEDANVQVFVNLWLIANRAEPLAALDQLEEMRLKVTTAIKTGAAPIGRWTTFGRFGATEVAGTMYATAVVEAVFVADDI